MRVLFVDQSAELGGAELSLISQVTQAPFPLSVLLFQDGPLAGQLRRLGIDTEVLRTGPIQVRRESGWLSAIRAVPTVTALAWQVARRARGYDLIYANSQKAFVIAALATLFVRRPVVWHLHDILTAAHFGSFLRFIVVRLANWRARWVIVNSGATAAAFESLGGDKTRVSIVHQGIDDQLFSEVTPKIVAALRAELGGDKAKLIGVFGRLAAWKGQAVFLQALAQVPDVIGIIVGEALFGEHIYEQELRRQVADLSLTERVNFLGFRHDIPALMCAMDVIVHSSIAPEPFGRVVVEGMLAGRPVVAAAAGGILEILTDGDTGFLYEPGSPAALRATLIRVLSDPALAARVAQAGQDHARSKFSAKASNNLINETLASLFAHTKVQKSFYYEPERLDSLTGGITSKSALRILYLDQTAELGGAEISLFGEVTNLPYRASVLLFQDGRLREMFEDAGVPVEVLASPAAAREVKKTSGAWAALAAAPAVARLVWDVAARARHHDVIYANSQKAFVVGALAAALTGRRLVWRLRDVLDETHFSPTLIAIVVRLANWKASCVIANSEATRQAFGAAGGDLSRAFVAYPGVDERPFTTVTDEQVRAMRASLGAGESKLIGVFGRLSAWKGQDVFAAALARVPGVVGVIVGGALFGEEAFEVSLREKIAALGLTDRMRLLGFRDDVAVLMRAMDVVVHCSVAAEPFGRVVVEGMLAGKPVVASRAGGVMEIVQDGVTGFLAEPGDVTALSSAISRAKGDISSQTVAQAGQDYVREHFTMQASIRQIENELGKF